MNVVAIIQARMGSTRLPGKVMMEVYNKPLLEYQIERVQRSSKISKIVVATTQNEREEPILELCKKLNVAVYRGSESDVLARYYDAATEYSADVVVRLTSDCPLIDPEIIDTLINYYLMNSYDYVSNTQVRSYPRGMDTEVFSYKALKFAYYQGKKDFEREHVTPYLYLNQDLFKVGQVVSPIDYSNHRWTVDTPEDLRLITLLLENLWKSNPDFKMNDILNILDRNPEWKSINAHIRQKQLGE